MRKLNRVIAAGALAVPMALGASGIAVADVAADSSGAPNQAGSEEDDFAACLEEAEEPEDVTACLDVVLGELEEVSNGRDFGQDINSPLG